MVRTRKGALIRSDEVAQSGPGSGDNEFITRSTIAEEVTKAIQAAMPAIVQQLNENTRKMIDDKLIAENDKKQPSDQKAVDNKVAVDKDFYSGCMPEFNGVCDTVSAMRWVFEMENIFKAIKCADEDKAMFAVSKLRSEALVWWAMVMDKDTDTDKSGSQNGSKMTWNQFKDMFKEKYYPIRMVIQLEEEFMTFKQGSHTVQEYTARFVEMARFAEHQVATEGRKIERYIRGLKNYIREFVAGKKVDTFQEAVQFAQEIENERNAHVLNEKNKFKRKKEGSESIMCTKCYKNHDGECWVGLKGCYRCGNLGHVAQDCLVGERK